SRPVAQVVLGWIVRKARAVLIEHSGFDLEANEIQASVGEKRLDLIECQAMLLYVENQIATFTGRIEIPESTQPLQIGTRSALSQISPEPSNVIGCGSITASSNELTRLDNVPARKLAIEA